MPIPPRGLNTESTLVSYLVVPNLKNIKTIYLSKQLTSKSLPEIGRTFGGRDHTTVMHAVSRIDELSLEDSLLSDDIELLKRTLDS